MSFYATIAGEIRYPNRDVFDKVVKLLTEGSWVEGRKFVDECNNVITDYQANALDDIRPEALVISIPFFCHRNLARHLEDVMHNATGLIIWSSTDGCFEGGILRDGVEKTFDLTKWAAEQKLDEPPDPEDTPDEYCEWMNEVEQEFHDWAGGS